MTPTSIFMCTLFCLCSCIDTNCIVKPCFFLKESEVSEEWMTVSDVEVSQSLTSVISWCVHTSCRIVD